jgi:hypothetical protein
MTDVLFLVLPLMGVVGVFVVLYLISAPTDRKKKAALLQALRAEGIEPESLFFGGSYIWGHPSLDKPIPAVLFRDAGSELQIYSGLHPSKQAPPGLGAQYQKPQLCGAIPKAKIGDVRLEDASSVGKRITATRAALFGALVIVDGLKKTVTETATALVITWNDGHFDHETVFQFQGSKVSATLANETRNRILRGL